MNAKTLLLLKTVAQEYQRTGQPVRRSDIWKRLLPNAYRTNGHGIEVQIRYLVDHGMIDYLKQRCRAINGKTSRTTTALITPTVRGLDHVSALEQVAPTKPDRLAHALTQCQQAMPLAQEISRLDLDTKNQEIATLKSINAEQAEEIKSLKRKLAKLASIVSVDDLLAMI